MKNFAQLAKRGGLLQRSLRSSTDKQGVEKQNSGDDYRENPMYEVVRGQIYPSQLKWLIRRGKAIMGTLIGPLIGLPSRFGAGQVEAFGKYSLGRWLTGSICTHAACYFKYAATSRVGVSTVPRTAKTPNSPPDPGHIFPGSGVEPHMNTTLQTAPTAKRSFRPVGRVLRERLASWCGRAESFPR